MAEPRTLQLVTRGMHCPSCAMMLKMTLEDLDGISEASADAAAGLTTVTFDPDTVGVEAIVEAISAAGYEADVPAAS